MRWSKWIVLPWIGLLLAASGASAADACPALRGQRASPDAATRIAAVACDEHMLWFRPFIDADGRIASITVVEGEGSRLGDGATPAWRRVADYWRDSGMLSWMHSFSGADQCGYARANDGYASVQCRAFVIDNAWSAAFVSYVMAAAQVPGFRGSASHSDYVRDAYQRPDSPYLYLDPATAKPAAGDLLCYVRNPARAYGYAGLRGFFDAATDSGLNMHCDIVAAANPGNDGKAYLIGGNVQQGVTMRLLALNRNGEFWSLPQRTGAESGCAPDNGAACNFNRQDWAVLLKLKPADALALLPPPRYIPGTPMQAPASCCVNCVLGADPPVPRCPKPETP